MELHGEIVKNWKKGLSLPQPFLGRVLNKVSQRGPSAKAFHLLWLTFIKMVLLIHVTYKWFMDHHLSLITNPLSAYHFILLCNWLKERMEDTFLEDFQSHKGM